MVDNTNNQHGVAPDKGQLDGPVIGSDVNTTHLMMGVSDPTQKSYMGNHPFWMESVDHGRMPHQPGPYTFFRNVKDYGAKGDGVTDDTAAINAAVSAGSRCGLECGSNTISGALVYFPAGTYMISTPIIQLYYTQFVGDPTSRPKLKGMNNFKGIALVDTDPYIPGGSGAQWYINQNQFFRQVRNIIFDLTVMNDTNTDGDQRYVATGLHWQVAQATSIQNCDFIMPDPHDGSTSAVGIFMENGGGGFVSDLYFFGGNIGFRAGSQQFTGRGIRFQNCGTAISHIWNWGFLWKNIEFNHCYVAIDCTLLGSGPDKQGTGSITLLDSAIINVSYAIPVNPTFLPSIVLDNVNIQNVEFLVYVGGSTNYLSVGGSTLTIKSWAMGKRYTSIDDSGAYQIGFLNPVPSKPTVLLDSTGKFYTRSKPQYELFAGVDFIVVTDHGVSNDGTSDQADAINTILYDYIGKPVFFPAGIYLVKSTIFVPVNSVLIGEGWSQIMASGDYFSDEKNPQVVVRFGYAGDVGSMEVSDFLFTVQGPTAGAILVEWNVRESFQGSVAMWDCHFRVGGAIGSDLQFSDCPKQSGGIKDHCKAASLLLHITSSSSGYFENIWAWAADHDIDWPIGANASNTSASQISVYSARGVLIESSGPVWLYGTTSEHNVFYQYQFSGAKNIYSGNMQAETPYYMPNPNALGVFETGIFKDDPTWSDCDSEVSCIESWALRILRSDDIYIYSAGFYNFFNNYTQDCLDDESCQERLVETSYVWSLWLYGLFTKGATQPISPQGGLMRPVLATDPNNGQSGYTTQISAWLSLVEQGEIFAPNDGMYGSDSEDEGSGVVYIDPSIWGDEDPTVYCIPPCIIILPPKETTITYTFPPIITTIPVWTGDDDHPTIVTTTIVLPPFTATSLNYWNINITTLPITTAASSSIQPPPIIITETPNMVTTTFYPPPHPLDTSSATYNNPTITIKSEKPKPTCKKNCGHRCDIWCGGICIFDCIPCLFCNGINPPSPPPPPGPPPGPGQPSSQSQSTSDCTTTTTSECLTLCQTTSGTSCSSTCSPVIQCEASPTNGYANLGRYNFTNSTFILPFRVLVIFSINFVNNS
ncbi:glycoside hydrolase family 55 protein [Hypoxylon sp. EC38]|nr:glycoside hydrolase family 55 protein [Hypoxylon sp. EC38]